MESEEGAEGEKPHVQAGDVIGLLRLYTESFWWREILYDHGVVTVAGLPNRALNKGHVVA